MVRERDVIGEKLRGSESALATLSATLTTTSEQLNSVCYEKVRNDVVMMMVL